LARLFACGKLRTALIEPQFDYSQLLDLYVWQLAEVLKKFHIAMKKSQLSLAFLQFCRTLRLNSKGIG
jgi:hypothetical protein